MGDDREPGAGNGRLLEALLDEMHCTALDVIAYLVDLEGPDAQVDALAACVRRYLELLDELASRRGRRLPS
jgi:hypothetical protein